MMDLNQTRVFVEVVRSGGFAAAARRLGLPKSTVSARVQALEARLGAQLLRRSTRRLALTAEGEAYFRAVEDAIDALTGAEAAASPEAGVLAGLIRLTAPMEFPRSLLAAAILDFRNLHSNVRFDVVLSNERLDLVAENFDLGLRFGAPGSAGLIVRRIGATDLSLYASPAYLEARGAPQDLDALMDYDRLVFTSPLGSPVQAGTRSLVRLGEPAVKSNNLALLRALAVMGGGVVELPETMARRYVQDGRLASVLESSRAPPVEIHLAFPSRRALTPRVKAFADHLARALD